tara:strand:- start:849 stop:2030 length:1182 start_codon:yes stop_codon:yes gene_type:complete
MKKMVSVLGSTGSIGLNAINIFRKKKDIFKFNLLSANKNYNLICKQIDILKPKMFIINDYKIFIKIKNKYKNKKVKILNEIKLNKNFPKSDITVAAIPGIAGLLPTISMIKKSKKILIANKESIICGWNLIKKAAKKNKTIIVPVDSEHYSIMKLMENLDQSMIRKIYLTASGGPFLNYKLSKLKNVKPNEAIKHPKWKMGKKISIDSATLMNKMLELIEAQKLFSITKDKIEILIHPQSLVHAVIELNNGIYKFISHETTMLIPLSNAIFDGNLRIEDFIKIKKNKKNLFSINNLNFHKVDIKRFPTFRLKDRLNEHVSTPIIINAANEILVDQYLDKKIPFNSFFKYLSLVMKDRNYRKYAIKEPKNIRQIYLVDKWSREITLKYIREKNA